MASKTLKEIEKVVDDYEKQLKKQGYVVFFLNTGITSKEVNLNLIKDKGLEEFFKDFLYYNHLSPYESPDIVPFTHTIQSNSYNSTCHRSQRRSIGDLFRLARKYYSEDITLWDVMEAMYNIVQKNTVIKTKSGKYFGCIYSDICSTIKRRVFNLYLNNTSRSNYKFTSASSNYLKVQDLNQEFFILGEDYNTIFNTIAGKDFLKRKRESNFTLQVSPQEELDRAVMEKLAKMQSRPLELKSQVIGGFISKGRRSALIYDDDIDF